MAGVLVGFSAIWAVTAVGWFIGRTGLLGPRAERVLARLAFFVLTPALLFTTLSRSDPARLLTPALGAFAISVAVIGALGAALARFRWRRPAGETVVAGLCASYVNAANLGIPVAAYVLGDVSAIAAVLLLQVLVVAPAALAVLDAGHRAGPEAGPDARGRAGPETEAGHRAERCGGRGGGRGGGRSLGRLALLPARNPIMLGSAAGVASALLGWQAPPAALRPVELLGSAAVPVALLALGVALATGRADPGDGPDHRAPAAVAGAGPAAAAAPAADAAPAARAAAANRDGLAYALVALKTVGQPLVAYLVGRHGLGLGGPALLAAVVTAALPTAQNVFVFAARYERAETLARDAVMLSTIVAAVTMAVVAVALG